MADPSEVAVLLDEKLLDSLSEQLPKDGVLTAILNVNPGHPDNAGGALFTRARNLLRESGAPPELVDAVQADLGDAQRATGRTRAYLRWANGMRAIDSELEAVETVTYGAPNLEPLRQTLELHPPTAIALVDHERGRLFLVRGGWIVERRRMENTLENDLAYTVNRFRDVDSHGRDTRVARDNNDPDAEGGHRVLDVDTDYDLAARQADQQEHLFYKQLVDYLDRARLAGEYERLLVSGPVKAVTHLKSVLTTGLSDILMGEFNVEAGAPVAEVFEAAREALDRAEREADGSSIRRARERGVRGPADTIAAVQEGRVYELLVAGDGSGVPVWQDTDPDSAYVFASYPEQGQSPLSGQAVESKTLHDVLPLFRERFGVKVNYLDGENQQLVQAEMDGVAGLTRF